MSSLFFRLSQPNQARTAYSMNSEANRIAQSNPARAAELRWQAYAMYQAVNKPASDKKKKAHKPAFSVSALNSKANRIAQTTPELAIQLRMQAAYA